MTIPPALMSLLLPHLNQLSNVATPGSGSVTTALVQRTKILQEENDELYELLRIGETGRLKEDVRALRRVVQKLEGALRGACATLAEPLFTHSTTWVATESHQVIASLSYVLAAASHPRKPNAFLVPS